MAREGFVAKPLQSNGRIWLREVTLKLGNAINRGHAALDGAVGVAIASLLKVGGRSARWQHFVREVTPLDR